jgi:iron complex transport system substrate-binding protein
MQKHLLKLITLLALALSAACTPAAQPTPIITAAPPIPAPITLTDGRGVDITLDAPADRILSLAPSNTELLFAVGAGGQIAGRDSFSDFPAEALSITDIGGGWGELNTEVILTLNADLVLSADIIAPEQNTALEDLGFTVFVLPNPVGMDGLYANLETVGKLTGHETEAAAAIASLQARVTAVTEAVAAAETTPLTFYQLDSTDPAAPWTAGPGTFIDTLITLAGGVNVAGSLDGAWVQISAEELIAQNPDIILLGDAAYSGLTPEDVAARPGWDAIAAVQNGQVFAFDDNLASRPGPRLVDGLETLAKLLHPELFP